MATVKGILRRLRRVTSGGRSAADPAFLDEVYDALFARKVDPAGRANVAHLLRSGWDPWQVVLDLARSEEYRNRVAAQLWVLPDLRVERPELFTTCVDSNGAKEELLLVQSPDDFDWIEDRIGTHGYYNRPGSWLLEVNDDKRLMAELVAAFAPRHALELGCSSGVVLDLLLARGVEVAGLDLSPLAKEKAPPSVRDRIIVADVLDLDASEEYDVIFGLDIFEHFNPNRLPTYLSKIAQALQQGGVLLANIPSYGPDAVLGEVLPLRFSEWRDDAAAGRTFRLLEIEDGGYPLHGHTSLADSAYWTGAFGAVGLQRVSALETAIQKRYDDYFRLFAPFRRPIFVFAKGDVSDRTSGIVAALATRSPELARIMS